MLIGGYRIRIGLQTKRVYQDEEGNLISQWSDWKKVWTAVKPSKAREGMQFQIRYISGIPKDLRINYLGEIYDVKNKLDPNGKHQHVKLFCEEVVHGDSSRGNG